MRTPRGEFRFHSWNQAGILAAFLAGTSLLLLAGSVSTFTHPHRHEAGAEQVAFVLGLIGLGLLLARVVRSGTLIASDAGVECRTILRTLRWQWTELNPFEEVVGVIGPSRVARRYVRAHLRTGSSVNLTELNVSQRQNPDRISHLVQTLNAMLPSAGP